MLVFDNSLNSPQSLKPILYLDPLHFQLKIPVTLQQLNSLLQVSKTVKLKIIVVKNLILYKYPTSYIMLAELKSIPNLLIHLLMLCKTEILILCI